MKVFLNIHQFDQILFKMMGFLTEGIQFAGIQIEGQHSVSPQIIDFTFSRPPNSKDL